MADSTHVAALFASTDRFVDRHIAPSEAEIAAMLEVTGFEGLEALTAATVPEAIRREAPLALPQARSEAQMLARARELAAQNRPVRSYLGMGYVRTITPPVIARNILENPAWYTQYTPYQPEIAQGRLEAILNFQTVVTDLTGMDIANASLLDEGTAAAEAMTMCAGIVKGTRQRFWVAASCHPQTIAVLQTRAQPMGIEVVVAEPADFSFDDETIGALVQYPDTAGEVHPYGALCERAHEAGAMMVVATDLLAMTLLTPPGAWGADVVVGSAQRFGVPMGFGGPHAAFFATRDAYKRKIPGRLVGVTRDARGEQALRLALQTREQHIRRDKATSNICTSQVLLAVMASMYAVYHGPEGLRRIAARIMGATQALGHALKQLGFTVSEAPCFDTLWVQVSAAERDAILSRAKAADVELRQLTPQRLALTLDEAVTRDEVEALVRIFGGAGAASVSLEQAAVAATSAFEGELARTSDYLTHPTFHLHHSEHEMLRYMYRLQQRDLSLTTSMIPLGSCTMKLNATAEMVPISLEGFANLHPFTDPANARGYGQLIKELEAWLGEITGMAAVSLQPNAGSQGEYAGLLAIRAYHEARGEAHRDVCLIPSSAHGTNPASAAMAGMQVVVVRCDARGNVDLEDLEAKAQANAAKLAAVMVTYPSTHGVFEAGILQLTEIVHRHGGQVYMDGANMNAQVGLCRPGDFGVDVCHLNLHKTFCIPHGGGGPGVGPIAVREHLAVHLPNHPVTPVAGVEGGAGAVSAAPYGSASILPISWMYIGMMGAQGLRRATQVAILNANYLAKRLSAAYPLLYTGAQGTVAHEFILDLRPLRDATGVTVVDVAKRLMDYGFHAPTMSWPVEGTLMIEPTESESKAELDRFAQAMLSIREEIEAIARGEVALEESVLRHAPHTAATIMAADWDKPYSREQAAHPVAWTRQHKFWPAVSRVDDTYGDRNLMCSCPPLTDYNA